MLKSPSHGEGKIYWELIPFCFAGLVIVGGVIALFLTEPVNEEKNCEINILPTEKIYMHQYGTTEDPYSEDLHGDLRCSCVRAVRSWGVDLPYGINAEDIEPNTEIEIGVVAIFNEKSGGHIGLVTRIGEKGFWVKESNYVKCEITERFIDFDDYRLVGYYK